MYTIMKLKTSDSSFSIGESVSFVIPELFNKTAKETGTIVKFDTMYNLKVAKIRTATDETYTVPLKTIKKLNK